MSQDIISLICTTAGIAIGYGLALFQRRVHPDAKWIEKRKLVEKILDMHPALIDNSLCDSFVDAGVMYQTKDDAEHHWNIQELIKMPTKKLKGLLETIV